MLSSDRYTIFLLFFTLSSPSRLRRFDSSLILFSPRRSLRFIIFTLIFTPSTQLPPSFAPEASQPFALMVVSFSRRYVTFRLFSFQVFHFFLSTPEYFPAAAPPFSFLHLLFLHAFTPQLMACQRYFSSPRYAVNDLIIAGFLSPPPPFSLRQLPLSMLRVSHDIFEDSRQLRRAAGELPPQPRCRFHSAAPPPFIAGFYCRDAASYFARWLFRCQRHFRSRRFLPPLIFSASFAAAEIFSSHSPR